jgi:hypothetical protein
VWYGWSGIEPEFRWTDGKRAALVFALPRVEDMTLQIKAGPFVTGERLPKQLVGLSLNGHQLEWLELAGEGMRQFSLLLPKQMLSGSNVLTLELPQAASPGSLGVGDDSRLLGIRVEWIEFRRAGSH